MGRYLLQRLVALVFILFLITIFCFTLVHLLPGDPTTTILGTSDTPKNRAIVLAQLGLNKGIFTQYLIWIGNVFHGNLGHSFTYKQPVSTIITGSIKIDLELIVISQIIAYAVAVPLSIYGARRAGGAIDQSATSVTFAFYCLPSFIIIVWLVQLLCVHWHLLPGTGSEPYPSGMSWPAEVFNNLKVMLLPSLVLSIGSIAVYYRLLRNEMVSTLQEEFITVARSKGLGDHRILWRHALRPSSVTMLTSTGNNVALLITGLFIVEYKMGLAGIGFQLIAAITGSDYLTIQGITLFTAVIVVVVNFAIDIITTFVDPRIARA